MVLQQLFRMFFGSANVDVDSPAWLLGNVTISNVIFGYNRLFVIGFASVIILLTWLLLTKSPLGLLIRSVTQNRQMAACVGVRTERVNMLTFAFGSGLAGLAGAFLSQIGNVGPSMGQNYIIDCFMTVVVGGVGNIVGTVCSAMGIGMADQMLQEILQNPVIGQIIVLVVIILFLQWKPGGLFPSADVDWRNNLMTQLLRNNQAVLIGLVIAFLVIVIAPALNTFPAENSFFHLSDFTMNLWGKYFTYGVLALSIDLLWGYTGLLSLGQCLFFALGGYALGCT